MKNFTETGLNAISTLFAVVVFTTFSFAACSSSKESDSLANETNKHDVKGNRTLSFHDDDDVHWRVRFKDDEITSIYKDGKRIPDSEIPKYKNFINEKVGEIDEGMKEFHSNMKNFHVDMEKFHENMDKMKEDLSSLKFDFKFDDEQFKKDMKKMSSELKLAFDSDEFKENMKRLKEEMKNIKVDFDMDKIHAELHHTKEQMKNLKIDIDMSELRKEMARLKEELRDVKVDIDFSQIDENLAKAKEEMKKAKADLKEAKKGIRKFKYFMNDFREELEKDGLIEDSDEDFDMEFNSKELIINGKKASDDLHKKYKKMYEERLGKKMDDDMNIKTNK